MLVESQNYSRRLIKSHFGTLCSPFATFTQMPIVRFISIFCNAMVNCVKNSVVNLCCQNNSAVSYEG